MLGGIKDLLASERGVFALLLLVAITVLLFTKWIDVEGWLSYTKWLAVTLIASKTVTSAIEARLEARPPVSAP